MRGSTLICVLALLAMSALAALPVRPTPNAPKDGKACSVWGGCVTTQDCVFAKIEDELLSGVCRSLAGKDKPCSLAVGDWATHVTYPGCMRPWVCKGGRCADKPAPKPTTPKPTTTAKPTTSKPTTAKPTTPTIHTTVKPTTPTNHTTAKPTTTKPPQA